VRTAPLAVPTSVITLKVQTARTWIPSGLWGPDAAGAGHAVTTIPTYNWVIVRDDTGNPTKYRTTPPGTGLGNWNYDCVPQSRGGDPLYPANCQWPAIHSESGGTSGQIVAKGTQADLSTSTSIDFGAAGFGAGKYMISVTAEGFDLPAADCSPSTTVTCHADGFKIDGQWFSVPMEAPGLVTVSAQPYPLPLTTVRMKVWNDTQTNGAYDDGEPPLAGFEGQIADVLGFVTTDWYGNPLCTSYQHDTSGLMLFGHSATFTTRGPVQSNLTYTSVDASSAANAITIAYAVPATTTPLSPLTVVVGGTALAPTITVNLGTDATGAPNSTGALILAAINASLDASNLVSPAFASGNDGTGIAAAFAAAPMAGGDDRPRIAVPGGRCFSDANGVVTIPYLGPNRYAATVTPRDGHTWYQTSTLEGWHDWDTWAIEGWNGYDPEFVQGAEPFPFAQFGFVEAQSIGDQFLASTPMQATLPYTLTATTVPASYGPAHVTVTHQSNGATDTLGSATLTGFDAAAAAQTETLALVPGGVTTSAKTWTSLTSIATPSWALDPGVPAGLNPVADPAIPAAVDAIKVGFIVPNSTGVANADLSVPAGVVKGTVVGVAKYAPAVGGLNLGGTGAANLVDFGAQKILENIKAPLVSLLDANGNDLTVYMGKGNADGTFQINNVPDGDYILTYWDEDQAYMLTQGNLKVQNGQTTDLGVLDAAAWWATVKGRVCFDTNRDGKCQDSEPGLPGKDLNLLNRDNSLSAHGDNTATTDANGYYTFPRAYPYGQWVVLQGYWEQYYTVGITYQALNQPTETTLKKTFVDVSTFNAMGIANRVDWAIHTYETDPALGPTNGGIAGEVVYNLTRNETDARHSAAETYEPGVPNITVHLFWPVACTTVGAVVGTSTCTRAETPAGTALYLTDNATGAYVRGPQAAADYVTETWLRPTDCVARGADGTVVKEAVLPVGPGHDCLEAPLMASQIGDNGLGDFMQVNGNFGFGELTTNADGTAAAPGTPLPPADFIVAIDIPKDPLGKPLFNMSKEEDINVMSGDQFVAAGETQTSPPTTGLNVPVTVAPAVLPFICAGALHTVHVVDTHDAAQFDPANPSTTSGVYNPDYLGAGGSFYEGTKMPLCDQRLVTVQNGKSSTPMFHLWTDTPLPGRLFGVVVDDLNLSVNPKELFFGEKYGIPELPIGIYDFSNRLVTTIQTDPQGFFEVILPSTSTYNCPLPAGPCPGTYRFIANDPGQPGHVNANYNPQYRTIGAFFEVWPGVSMPADLAPVPIAMGTGIAGTQTTHPAPCLLNNPATPTAPQVPELFSIGSATVGTAITPESPYVLPTQTTADSRTRRINGANFGNAQGTGTVTLDGTPMTIVPNVGTELHWTDTYIDFQVPAATAATGAFPAGPKQLVVTTNAGVTASKQSTVNGLTFHVLDVDYLPAIFEVGPGRTFNSTTDSHAIQHALDQASRGATTALVVVYPNTVSVFNPIGSYYENVIVTITPTVSVKLQGVGPGGTRADGTQVPGTVLDGLGFGTDSDRDTAWQNTLTAAGGGTVRGPAGTQISTAASQIPEGEVILVVSTRTSPAAGLPATSAPSIDGLLVQNGEAIGLVPNNGSLGNGVQILPNTTTNVNQGGGITAFASIPSLQITNNIIRSNGGVYSGGIRLGTPQVGNNNLARAHIANNRILNNGGSIKAGAVGVFTGTNNYEINNNDICGNFSAEYGGGISHFGRSNNGSIHDNRVYINGSYDEGGGIMIAGELPLTPTGVSAGSGPVDIFNNKIQANMSGDDGGGIRFLTAGNYIFNVYNNIIAGNISAHEGGGIAIDNAPRVRFYNNTVMDNITTATAATSDGNPAPAGLSTARNNYYFQRTLGANAADYSNPVLFNNIFWNNRAGKWDVGHNAILGIGGKDFLGNPISGDVPNNYWDMGIPGEAAGSPRVLSPRNSILQSPTAHPGVVLNADDRVNQDPLVLDQYLTSVLAMPWRGNPAFVSNVIVAQDVPASIMGNYHIQTGSPAVDNGRPALSGVTSPTFDIDYDTRPIPANGNWDIGADERLASGEIPPPPVAPAAAPAAQAPVSIAPANLKLLAKPAALQPATFAIQTAASAYHADWVAQSAYPTAAPGQLAEWVVAFRNTGTAGWYKGVIGANAGLGASQPLNNEIASKLGLDPGNWQYPSRFAIQTTDYVGPGQIGWFVIQVKAPTTAGSYRIHLRPVIDGLSWLEDYGVYFDLNVAGTTMAPATNGNADALAIFGPTVALNASINLATGQSFEGFAGGTLQ